MNSTRQKIVQNFLIFVIGIIFSILITSWAFSGHFFKLTMDGYIHLERFKSIKESFAHNSLPPLVNFIGFGNVGEVFTAMYPWLTGLIFIIPELIFSNPMHAFFFGFVLLNFLTILNSYLMTCYLTRNIWIRLTGVTIYELNAYHMTLMYARNALGEALAYTFIPLVFLGIFMIWNDNSKGIPVTGFGMGLVINSHVITSLTVTSIIIIIEFYRIFVKKFTFKEFKSLILSALVATLISLYQLVNMIFIMAQNHTLLTWRNIITIPLKNSFDTMLSNQITDLVFNMGLLPSILLMFLSLMALNERNGEWKKYILLSMILFFLTFDFISYPTWLTKSVVGTIQFSGRLLGFVVLFLTIGIVLFLNDRLSFKETKILFFVITFALCLMSENAVNKFHYLKNDDPIRYYLTSHNFNKILSLYSYGDSDYILAKNDNTGYLKKTDTLPSKYLVTDSYNKLTLRIDSKKDKNKKINFFFYKGIKYNVKLNGKNIKNYGTKRLSLHLKKGTNIIEVSSNVAPWNYITFFISTITLLSLIFIIFLKKRYRWQS